MKIENSSAALETVKFDDWIARAFLWATMIWGLVGMLVGLLIATQLIDWRLNFDLPWLTFGRLRPLHTNAVIFAFAANSFFAACYYSTQRLLKTRMYSDLMSRIHFWGWQLIIVAAAISFPIGWTQGREYAELIWPIDMAVTIIWVIFTVNFLLTLWIRREKHIYVAIWFYIASILAIAMLHVVNNIQLPVSWTLSYSVYAGAQDALVQWWYGHNAVGFLLTTPFLGMMYYFLPKAADRPIFSYRLSIIHFWALVFIYIWAGPHHLYYSALPEWLQSLGMVFSIMLWAPSWGGMLNGLYTLRGAWHKVREEPILKFFVAAVTAYGMSTFEGPLLSIKAVNKISHFTDWTIAHVHVGALGWVGFMTFGMIYYLIPKLWKRPIYSRSLANAHFWIGLIGILLYAVPLWIAGVTQALMWLAMDDQGALVYPDFMETVKSIMTMYYLRAIGGSLFIIGVLIMLYNFLRSIAGVKCSELVDTEIKAAHFSTVKPEDQISELFDKEGKPKASFWKQVHRLIEGWPLVFSAIALMALMVGGLVQIVPMILVQASAPKDIIVRPYTGLELLGRDIYIREGCYNCHSQQVRPILEEAKRYGPASKAYEYMYDHPFQWGSKRTGPDLHRVGGKYPDLWHYRHLEDPRSVSANSLMPPYPWLLTANLDISNLETRLKVLKKLGVPYRDQDIEFAKEDLEKQALEFSGRLNKDGGVKNSEKKEIVALIVYLQRLGKDAQSDSVLKLGESQ